MKKCDHCGKEVKYVIEVFDTDEVHWDSFFGHVAKKEHWCLNCVVEYGKPNRP